MPAFAQPDISVNKNLIALKYALKDFERERRGIAHDRKMHGKSIIHILDLLPGFSLPDEVDTERFLIKEGHVRREGGKSIMQILPDEHGDLLEVELDTPDDKNLDIALKRQNKKDGLQTTLSFSLQTGNLKIKNVKFSFQHKKGTEIQTSGFNLDDYNTVSAYTGTGMNNLRMVAPLDAQVKIPNLIEGVIGDHSIYTDMILKEILPGSIT